MLVDTSGFLCIYQKEELFHQKAIEFYDSTKTRLTTNYVLTEYTALAQIRGISRQRIIEFSYDILSNQEIEIVWVDEDLHVRAVNLIKERKDKAYSLCDAVSFVLMRERKINEALTTDKHFEQEGFVRLLK